MQTYPSTKTLLAKAMNLSRRLLRVTCDGRYFHSVNLLAWTDLSQQRCGFTTMAPFPYSDTTTFKSSAGVYISYTRQRRGITYTYALALGRYTPSGLPVYNPYAPQCCGITNSLHKGTVRKYLVPRNLRSASEIFSPP